MSLYRPLTHRIVCQVYVAEIAPTRIRGGLLVFQATWSNIGGIIVSVMMQQLNQKHPDEYLLAMRILWAPIALMLACWIWIPESPWHLVRKGQMDKAKHSLKMLFGGVEGYDIEEEVAIIARTIAHEQEVLVHKPSYADCFKGVNLVGLRMLYRPQEGSSADTPQKRTLSIMILSACGQLGGLAIVATYSTYFFSLAGLQDPFLGSLILA